jgi:hypothetical protein
MPLPFALPVGLLMGLTLAWFARAELARSDVSLILTRPFLATIGLAALIFGPVVGYFTAFHADWAYLYLVRPSRIPSAVDLVLVMLAAAQIPLGFVIAAPWAIAKRSARVLKVTVALAAPLLMGCVVFSRRLQVAATFAQFHGAYGTSALGGTPLGRGILLSWVALALGFAWSFHVVRSGRRN